MKKRRTKNLRLYSAYFLIFRAHPHEPPRSLSSNQSATIHSQSESFSGVVENLTRFIPNHFPTDFARFHIGVTLRFVKSHGGPPPGQPSGIFFRSRPVPNPRRALARASNARTPRPKPHATAFRGTSSQPTQQPRSGSTRPHVKTEH